jgi:hypothetical protein
MEGGPERREDDEGKAGEESLEELRGRLRQKYPEHAVENSDRDAKQTHPELKGGQSTREIGESDLDETEEYREYLRQKYDVAFKGPEASPSNYSEPTERPEINHALGAPGRKETMAKAGASADLGGSKPERPMEESKEKYLGAGRRDRQDPEGPSESNPRHDQEEKVEGATKIHRIPRATDSEESQTNGHNANEKSAVERDASNPKPSLEELPQTNHEQSRRLPEHLMDYYSKVYSDDPKKSSPTIMSRACERPTNSGRVIRFELPTRYVEERLGVTFHEGRLFRISGKLQSKEDPERAGWNFEIYRVGREDLKLRIHLPNRYHQMVTPGDFYKVTVDTVQEVKTIDNPRKIASLVQHGANWSPLRSQDSEVRPSESMLRQSAGKNNAPNQRIETDEPRELRAKRTEWKTVAAWMDTEGYLYTKEGRQRRYELVIKQSEAEPLYVIQRFLQEQGVDGCKVRWRIDPHYTAGGIFELKVKSIRDIDRIISSTEPFLLTSIRRNQYERYRQRRKEAASKIEFNQNESGTQVHSELINWKVLATWIDAEGNLSTRERPRKNRDYCLDVSQKEKAPLESLSSFLNLQGIKSRVVSRPHETYSLQVTRVSDLDKIVSRTEPFIIREDKKLQFEKYKSRRKRTPKRGPRPKPFST